MADHDALTFGKENGLVHEAVVTGRKAGAGTGFWSRLAHDLDFFRKLVALHAYNDSKNGSVNGLPLACPKWRIWRTVYLGCGPKSAEEFRDAIADKSLRISEGKSKGMGDNPYVMMSRKEFTIAKSEQELHLVNLSITDLGFSGSAKIKEVYARALTMGLELCPPEVGPQLILQLDCLPPDTYLQIAMTPIEDEDFYLDSFMVCCDEDDEGDEGVPYLGYCDNFDETEVDENDHLIFVRRS